MDKTIPPVPAQIGDLMRRRGYSLNALAEASGIAYSTLHRKLTRDLTALTMRELLALAAALKVSPQTVIGAIAYTVRAAA